jgi:glycosyltransferase involved in cell wall biosynthesis
VNRAAGASPAVSVIVPTFQRCEYVQRAVSSVLAQAFTDFELIVVDDGSTDGTGDALAGLDPRLRYHWQPNRGPGPARNAGIRLARGHIVAFLDSDNRWLPDHLSVVTEVLRLHPAAVLATTCPGELIIGNAGPQKARLVDFLPLALCDEIFGFLSCVAVRSEELVAVEGFNDELKVMEDTDLWLRLAARGPFAMLPRKTIVHQVTRGSRLHRGVLRGEYLEAFEMVSRGAVEAVSKTKRRDRSVLQGMARGRLVYSEALRSLLEGQADEVAVNLREACRLLPELSSQPAAVARRIGRVMPDSERRARALVLAAEAWPDQESDTALLLRIQAASAAFRTGRPVQAIELIRGLPVGPTVRFTFGNPGFWRNRFRVSVRSRLRGGDESPLAVAAFDQEAAPCGRAGAPRT